MIELTTKVLNKFNNSKKLLRITYDSTTIDNDHIVSESLKFHESICSSSTLKFGLAEKSFLKLRLQWSSSIAGKTIVAKIGVDCSDDSTITGTDSNGIYWVNLGSFFVESCKKVSNHISLYDISAYSLGMSSNGASSASYLVFSPMEKAKRNAYWKNNAPYTFLRQQYIAANTVGYTPPSGTTTGSKLPAEGYNNDYYYYDSQTDEPWFWVSSSTGEIYSKVSVTEIWEKYSVDWYDKESLYKTSDVVIPTESQFFSAMNTWVNTMSVGGRKPQIAGGAYSFYRSIIGDWTYPYLNIFQYYSDKNVSNYYRDTRRGYLGNHSYFYPYLSVAKGTYSKPKDYQRINASKYNAEPFFAMLKQISIDVQFYQIDDGEKVVLDEYYTDILTADPKLYKVTLGTSSNSEISIPRTKTKSKAGKTSYYCADSSTSPSTTTTGSIDTSNLKFLSANAELEGAFLVSSRDGSSVSFVKYPASSSATISRSEYESLEYETTGIAPYSHITSEITMTDGTQQTVNILLTGHTAEDENCQSYDLSDNYIISNTTFESIDDFVGMCAGLKTSLERINSNPYTVGNVSAVGFPNIQTGDLLNVSPVGNMLVTEHTLSGIQLLRDSIYSTGVDDLVDTVTAKEEQKENATQTSESVNVSYLTEEDVNEICSYGGE